MTRGRACRGLRREHLPRLAARGPAGRWPGCCSLALLVSLVAGGGAAKVGQTTVVLGQTATEPDPSCPELPCQAIGSVTGFQVNNGQTNLPFLVTHDGTIKAWTLTLAQPTNSQRSFFNGFFGTPPQARLAILRRVPATNPPRYNLRRQGSVKVLTPLSGPDGQVQRQPEGRKGRHHRPHRADLGAGLRPGPARGQRLARQPRTGHLHQLDRHPPGRTAGKGRQAGRPTAAATPPRACSTRRPWSRGTSSCQRPVRPLSAAPRAGPAR